jgi:putative hemolysin
VDIENFGVTVMSECELQVRLATSERDILACQRLRYEIFAQEMGASLPTAHLGLDKDGFDDVCDHLLVEDVITGEVIACTRILSDVVANEVGGYYYSDHEFDLSQIRRLQGRVMEIGRTCVHADHRNGATISVLWSGLAEYMLTHGFDFLMGCASVSMNDNGAQVNAIRQHLRDKSLLTTDSRRVSPRVPLHIANNINAVDIAWPPLLKAYLRLGAKVCGEPCLDADFGVADFFILLDVKDLSPRYVRHFLQRAAVPAMMPISNTMAMAA